METEAVRYVLNLRDFEIVIQNLDQPREILAKRLGVRLTSHRFKTICGQAINSLAQRVDIAEVISRYVVLDRSGRNYVGLCPFHAENTPSFSVNRERGFFHCFGCGAGGGVIEFLMRRHKCSPRCAALYLLEGKVSHGEKEKARS